MKQPFPNPNTTSVVSHVIHQVMTSTSQQGTSTKISTIVPVASSAGGSIGSGNTFELPDDISEDDENLLTNILSAVYAGGICSSYKVHVITPGFLIRGTLTNEEVFEIDLEDLKFIACANHIRIERIAICRCGGKTELVIKVLNSKQRVMVTTECTFMAVKKRKYSQIN
jgi:hypothetical protein